MCSSQTIQLMISGLTAPMPPDTIPHPSPRKGEPLRRAWGLMTDARDSLLQALAFSRQESPII